MSSGRLLKIALQALDGLRGVVPWARDNEMPAHLVTGQRGEEDAYFWLRGRGYTIVARNWRSPRRRGELDMIGWDNGVLCFIEVKTRTGRTLVPAEAAVDYRKQQELRAVAQEYLRRVHPLPGYRFDVVSVYYGKSGANELVLLRNAFPAEHRRQEDAGTTRG